MRFMIFFLTLLAVVIFAPATVYAGELTGVVAIEGRAFFNPPRYSSQVRDNVSLLLAPEYYHEWEERDVSFTAAPILRLDSVDAERSHVDIRELFFLKVYDSFEFSVGVRKIYWGVTESQHLVDIINQTDLVEGPDGEDKLGQPMISLSLARDYGTFDFYLLPYFRQRSFPGRKGRLRSEPYVDTGRVTYASNAQEYHPDLAFRYSHFIGDWEFALSHFWGTGREPTLIAVDGPNGPIALEPRYEIINQTGLEVQKVMGQWLLKAEAIRRSGQGKAFFATVTGFEYTMVGVGGTHMDVGLLGEWLYDDRGSKATTPFENDIFMGARLTVNDLFDTSILVGIVEDIHKSARFLFVESSRRITDRLRITLEARLQNLPENDRLKSIRDDDFVLLELAYYL